MENLMGRYRNVSILAAAIFLQIVGLAVQVKRRTENHSTRLIRVWAVGAVTPLEKTIVRVESGTLAIWHNYFYLRGVRQQNRELQQQIQQLELEQVRLRQDAEQAHRLQVLLSFKEQFIEQTIAAQVIGSSGSEQSRIIYLDKGASEGLTPDMAVISASGIVGKVIQVFRHTSQVLLINDQTSGVGTILEQSRLQGVLKGKPSGELILDKVMAEEEVKVGEQVLTSGGDQIFPKGLLVGTISKVNRGPEFLQVTVKPAATLTHLEEVLVISKKQEREPAMASNTRMRAADILAQRLPSVPDNPQPSSATGSGAKPDGSTASRPSANPAVRVASDAAAASSGGTQAPTGSAKSAAQSSTAAASVSGERGKQAKPQPGAAGEAAPQNREAQGQPVPLRTQPDASVAGDTASKIPSPNAQAPLSPKPVKPAVPPVARPVQDPSPSDSNTPGVPPQ
jgi:rod shape-determining protein MreC